MDWRRDQRAGLKAGGLASWASGHGLEYFLNSGVACNGHLVSI